MCVEGVALFPSRQILGLGGISAQFIRELSPDPTDRPTSQKQKGDNFETKFIRLIEAFKKTKKDAPHPYTVEEDEKRACQGHPR